MNFLFLRGQVPQDRDPQEIVFDTIEEVDDVWTQLIFNMTRPEDRTELWYWDGTREKRFSDNFTERWIPKFKTYKSDFVPDVIFCRGGFAQYNCVLNRFPKAFKIYYGAGRRFLPEGFVDYSLILQDSKEQLDICRNKFPKTKSELFIKPAADNIFYPIEGINKEFDIVFPANGRQEAMKGHGFVFKTAPKNLNILNLGNKGHIPKPNHITRKRVLRPKMAENLQKARVGIVCCDSNIDSCPRVIPELLACNIPIVCFDHVRFWREKYITEKTGILANKKNFWEKVEYALKNTEQFSSREYYDQELNLKRAADYIRNMI